MLIKELLSILSNCDPEQEVFFRKMLPHCGNIESVGAVVKSTYGFFGKSIDCYIIEPGSDDIYECQVAPQENMEESQSLRTTNATSGAIACPSEH